MRTIIVFAIYFQIVLSPLLLAEDLDSDRDGLSDYQETHKYLTNPNNKDSDGDGVPDGDWYERREYTYTIRSVIKIIRPVNIKAINDDYQDARVLSEKENYIELEVIHYPSADIDVPNKANRNWKKVTPTLKEYVMPGPATNWDDRMRRDLLAELKADGIMVDKLTDKQVVERVSSWLIRKSRNLDKVFTTFYAYFPDGLPEIYPGLEHAFEREFNRDKDNYGWSIDQHFDHELLGKGMFYNKTRGSCTSLAVYLTTVLRALGIPTRMVIVIPAIDSNDEDQLRMIERGISHHKIRKALLGAFRSQHGFVAHTFNEVYIDGRWCRLARCAWTCCLPLRAPRTGCRAASIGAADDSGSAGTASGVVFVAGLVRAGLRTLGHAVRLVEPAAEVDQAAAVAAKRHRGRRLQVDRSVADRALRHVSPRPCPWTPAWPRRRPTCRRKGPCRRPPPSCRTRCGSRFYRSPSP